MTQAILAATLVLTILQTLPAGAAIGNLKEFSLSACLPGCRQAQRGWGA